MMFGKAILAISALVFMSYGLVSLVSPAIPAGFAGLIIDNGDGYAEITAMYGGLQTGLGLFCVMALLNSDYYRSALTVLVFLLGTLALARSYSLLAIPESISDTVTAYTIGAMAFEYALAFLAIVALYKK
jgi:hypothetical protein